MKRIKLMKGDTTMKKYIIIAMIAVVSLFAMISNAEAQSYQFKSTSTMVSSGSSLSSQGTFQSADQYYNSTVQHSVARKAIGIDDDDSDDEENDPTDPFDPEHMDDPLPIGNGMLVLLLLAGGFALLQKRKAASVER